MPMYEVVLMDERRHAVRVTDQPLRLGQQLEMDGLWWGVVSEHPSDDPDVDARFLLARAQERPTR